MPASLRFVSLLMGLGALSAPVSIYVLHMQTEREARVTAEQLALGQVEAGKTAFTQFGCGACHSLVAAPGAQGKVGPSLEGLARRAEIAGVLANEPANLILWVRQPQEVVSGDGMPDQAMSERTSRDIAAYLYTLR